MIYVQDKHKLRENAMATMTTANTICRSQPALHHGDHQEATLAASAHPDANFSKSGVTAKKRKEHQRTSNVTTSGTRSEVTSALRLMAMPANTPATAST